MSLVNVKFRNTTVTVDVDDAERITKLAERFNARGKSVANHNHATDLKMAVITGLLLEDEIDQLQTSLMNKPDSKAASQAALGVLSDTIEQVATYIEQLTDRVELK